MKKMILLLSGILLASQALADSKKGAAEKILSDAWYTVTVNGKVHYGYYNDRVAKRNGRLFFQNHYWKKEEGFINEEQLGAYAEDNAELTPLFFNFHSTYRTTELSIDGTVTKGLMSVKVRKGGEDLPIVKKDVPAKTFFEVFFPVWVNRNEAQLASGKTVSYLAIFEDAVDDGFSSVTGRVKMEKPDDIAQKTGARKYSVEIKGMKSLWWFDRQGVMIRMEMPEQSIVVEHTSAKQAESFLNAP